MNGAAPDATGIAYLRDHALTSAEFTGLLRRSGLDARRPVDDPETITAMLAHANLTITAWRDERLVGVARSLTDYRYCCYLSDLAVDRDEQRHGIGRGLVAATRAALGPRCMLLLLAAPAAVDYYPHIGFERHAQAWMVRDAGHDGDAQ